MYAYPYSYSVLMGVWEVLTAAIQAMGMDIPTTDPSLDSGADRQLPAGRHRHPRRRSLANDVTGSALTAKESHGSSAVLEKTRLQADT